MSRLPKGWEAVSLPDCVFFQEGPGLRKWQFGESGVPFLNIRTFDSGSIDKSKCQFVKREEFEGRYEHFLLSEGDIVVSSSGTLGKLAVIKAEDLPLMLNTSVIRYRARYADHLLQAYLKFFLQSSHFFRQIEMLKTGSAIFNYGPSHLRSMRILVPPLTEQRRIVAKLERLLAKVEACRKRLAKIPVILKRFRHSVLAAACSGRLTAEWRGGDNEEPGLPHGWERMPLEDLLEKGGIFDGPFGSNLKTEDYAPSGVRVVRLENIGHLRFFGDKKTYITKEKYGSLIKHTVAYGDIIFSSFMADEIRACLLPQLDTKAIAKADCFCLRPDRKVIDRRYLTFQLVSQESYSKLIESVHGATRPRINTTQLRELQIRICRLEEQKEIVSRVEALFKFADQIEARYKKAQEQVDVLTQSILAKAFRGELVPTEAELTCREGRDCEPPSALLDRVLKDRADLNKRPKVSGVARNTTR